MQVVLLSGLIKAPVTLRFATTDNHFATERTHGAGHSSGCKSLDPPAWQIDPAWRMHLQFGLFSIRTSGMCGPVCGKVHIKDPLLLIGKSNPCGNSGLPLKKYVTMTTCLTSNSQGYENQCALEAF